MSGILHKRRKHDKAPIIFLAFGTVGDVLPLLLVAKSLVEEFGSISILFITGCDLILPLPPRTERFNIVFIDIPAIGTDRDHDSFYSFESRIKLYVEIINHEKEKNGAAFIVANLFALEGWLLGMALGVRCIFIHPHLPSSVNDEVSSLNKIRFSGDSSDRRDLQVCEDRNSDAMYWNRILWPLLHPVYDPVKAALGIIDRDLIASTIQSSVTLLLAVSPALLPTEWTKHLQMEQHNQDRAQYNYKCRVVGAIYARVLARKERQVASPCRKKDRITAVNDYEKMILTHLHYYRAQQECAGVFVLDFGSMTRVLDLTTRSAMTAAVSHKSSQQHSSISRLAAVLLRLAFPSTPLTADNADDTGGYFASVVLCHGGFPGLEEELDSLCRCGGGKGNVSDRDAVRGRILIVTHAHVDHATILSHQASEKESDHCLKGVIVVVHHGGAGTTFACAKAGMPQVVMPVMHDQFEWARHVHGLGLGPEPLAREVLFPEDEKEAVGVCGAECVNGLHEAAAHWALRRRLSHCIKNKRQLKTACVQLAARIERAKKREENGLQNCCAILTDIFLSETSR